jgi:hypothetical protein
MCINCLNIKLQQISSYETELKERIEQISCDTCKNYHLFTIGVLADLKMFCLIKIKKPNCCPNNLRTLVHMEAFTMQKVKTKLENVMEIVEEQREDVRECHYLDKMNDLRALYDCLGSIEDAEEN